jgi:hypothetical protein
MPDELLLYPGDTRRLLHELTAGAAFTVTAVTAWVYDSAGVAVVAGEAGDTGAGEQGATEIWYAWTPEDPGDYTYLLAYEVGGETRSVGGSVLVWPRWSARAPYLDRIRSHVREVAGDDASRLSLRDLRDALDAAVLAYSRTHPRRLSTDVALVAGQWEYNLSALAGSHDPAAAWVNDLSALLTVNPDYDAALQAPVYAGAAAHFGFGAVTTPYQLAPAFDVLVDEARGKFRFTRRRPGTGETARIEWTTAHTLNHDDDTLPAADQGAVAKWAAAEALERLATQAAGTTETQADLGIVNRRDVTERYAAQARKLREQAEREWRRWQFLF